MHSALNATLETRTLTGIFAVAAARFPDRPAVSDEGQTLTYTELDRRSSVLAGQLRERGIDSEDRVGLYLDRSVEVFVAILGILKAGAAYVAVEVRYPDARRDFMFAHSGAKLIITRPDWQGALSHLGAEIFPFRSQPSNGVVHAPAGGPLPSSAASVLFTSGSTGSPKAIVLEHGNIVSFACNPSLPQVRPEDRTGQISSLSFDAFHFEMWTTLLHGAEVAVLPDVPELLAADFQREMRRRGITTMLVPTMVVNHVVREDRDAFASLRILQAGGDVLLPSACRDLLAGRFQGELYNLYGPAEITTACTAQRVTDAEATLDAIPIGRPLNGVTLYILKPDLQPAALGETGELFVGGPGVARGYLDAPDLTDERFLPNPCAAVPSRLYRTGDLVRDRGDGTLDFIGRGDSQVKVRGYRVEPGEVERGLLRDQRVNQAVVLAAGEGNDRQLVAFVVLDEGLSLRELRNGAEADLPDFMVPSHFIALNKIPATQNGKRDVDALRLLLISYQERHVGQTSPATESERYLAGLWEALLGVENVGRNDDFFTLGGHSLLIFRVHTRIKRELGVELEYEVLLSNSILSDLASVLDAARGEGK
ncbi:non-ribosomal peptide synthetase [Streptomyces fildesensis]|uniref:non-ribosomal peptide synthetase n=1 Tax=Streptomyces fildesensis TaxID=375757 RepID=UPI0018DFB32C|nr:non-ribosomal peptide synthetase [Streptomyces fildesensis]